MRRKGDFGLNFREYREFRNSLEKYRKDCDQVVRGELGES